jgi:hypothetical protein
MVAHAGKHVMGVLPCCRREHKTGCAINAREDIHAHALVRDESMTHGGIDRKGALDCNAFIPKRLGQPALQLLLGRPADLICGLPQVTAGDENNLF